MEVAWSPTALRQIVRIFDYLTERNPHAAAEVFEALVDAGNRLENLPLRGRAVGTCDIRELMTPYQYIIRYRVIAGSVEIIRVRHTARRPTNP